MHPNYKRKVNLIVKKYIYFFLGMMFVSSAFVGCNSTDEESLVIYSGRSQYLINPILDSFAESTGIDVQVRYGGSVDLALLIEEEGEKSPADVYISKSPGPVAYLAERDLLSDLPEDVLAISPGSDAGNWVAVSGRQRVLVYNRENVTESELPESVFELTEANWKGRLAIAPRNGSFQDFFTLFRLKHGDDVALDWLKQMVANEVKVYANNNSIVQATARGEVDGGLVNHYYNARLKVENPDTPSENHRFVDGDSGSVTIATVAGIIPGGNEKNAEKLIRFLLDTAAQQYFTDRTYEYPVLAGIESKHDLSKPPTIDFGDFNILGSGLERTLELIREAGFDI